MKTFCAYPVNWRLAGIVLIAAMLSACAQVPRQSVELSTAVGRDVAAAHEAHRNLATALFARMKQDVNHFVDDVYAPFQIQYVLSKQKERQAQGNKINLFSATEAAIAHPDDAQAQKGILLMMQAIVKGVHADVEEFRGRRLAPVLRQEKDVMAAIERVYGQIQRGNATITAHLSSIVRVHDVQDEALQRANLEGLRERVGSKLSNASTKLATFVDKAKASEGTLDEISMKVMKLTEEIDKLLKED